MYIHFIASFISFCFSSVEIRLADLQNIFVLKVERKLDSELIDS